MKPLSKTTDHADLFYKPDGHYFLTHSIGLMPRSTYQQLNENYLQPWRAASDQTWPEWLSAIDEFRESLAQLLNSTAEQICPQANVSSGLSKLIPALSKRIESSKRKVIVVSEMDFPSTGFVFRQAEKLGFTLRVLPKSADLQCVDTWDDALDNSVHCVFITQVVYSTNARLPVEQITRLCQQRDILSIVDVAQAVGIVPIDLQTLGADIVLGSCIKWLCGGPGAGFLWLRRELIPQLEPIDVGWFSHQNPFEFDINNFEYHESSNRFWGGTPSVVSYISANNGIRLIKQIGLDAIQNHNQNLTLQLASAIPEQCIVSPKSLELKGGTLVIDFSKINESAKLEIEQRIAEKNIHCDSRQYGLRISPHIYNTADEIDQLIDCITY